MIPHKQLYARITIGDRAWYLRQLPRLLEAVHYSARMKATGVPDKTRLKILRRWNPVAYEIRQDMKALIRDLSQRSRIYE